MEEIQHGDHEGAGKMQLGYSETSGRINSLCIMDFTGVTVVQSMSGSKK